MREATIEEFASIEAGFDEVATALIPLSGIADCITCSDALVSLHFPTTAESILVAVADGETALYYNNIKRIGTGSGGDMILYRDGNTTTEFNRLEYALANGSRVGYVGYNTNDTLVIENEINAGEVEIIAEDSGGNDRTGYFQDPDLDTTLRADQDIRLENDNGGDTVLEGIINGDTTLRAVQDIRLQTDGGADLAFEALQNFDTTVRAVQDLRLQNDNGGDTVFEAIINQDTTVRAVQDVRLVSGATSVFTGVVSSVTVVRAATNIQLEANNGDLVFIGIDGGDTEVIAFRDIRLQTDDGADTVFEAIINADTIIRAVGDVELQTVNGEISLTCTANGGVGLRYNGTLRAGTWSGGEWLVISDGTGNTSPKMVTFTGSTFADKGRVGYVSESDLSIRNEIHGGGVNISAEDNGGNFRVILDADPDGVTLLNGDTQLNLGIGASEFANLRVDSTTGSGTTPVLVWDDDKSALNRILVGAAHSGGTGFKMLRVAN
jgi:catechol 2,3-dioxygenase-like lactoylglutathione lyase family enzyme